MPTTPEQIAQRLQALLTGATAAGANVYVDRDDAFTREESPAILIDLVKEDTAPMGGPAHRGAASLERNNLDFTVIVCVRGAAWRTQAEAVRASAHALIAADPALRQLTTKLRRTGGEWKSQSADQPFGYAAAYYAAEYLSRSDTLTTAPSLP
jgi:hypothetical protein